MMRALLVLGLAFGLSPAFAGDEAKPPRDMVVLTVSGLIGKTNRGTLDEKRDSMLAKQKSPAHFRHPPTGLSPREPL